LDLPRPGRAELFVLDERRTALAFYGVALRVKCGLNRQNAKNAKEENTPRGGQKLISVCI
jgi:hypothetical protein